MTKEVKYIRPFILSYLLLSISISPSYAEETTEESDLWSIESPDQAKSASIGQKKAATLRARLKRPSAPVSNSASEEKIARVFWLAPKIKADSFLLSFGRDPANLKNQLNISSEKLKELKDPVHGKLLGYAFPLKTKAKKIYYRLQAERAGNFSKKSPVTELILQNR